MTKVPNRDLRQAFLTLMDRAGKPIERCPNATPGQRGPSPEIYRLRTGQTVRLRTNNKPAAMALAKNGAVDAHLPFEDEDFLGIAFLSGEQKVAGYLVPSAVAAKAFREGHRLWLAADASHSRETKTRILFFDSEAKLDRPHHNYDSKWSKYCLGEIDLEEAATPSSLDQEIAEARRRIALKAHRPESAVRISIDF
jgi:hypothetical protein